jgi:opacity protein-like surface antigen
MRFKAGQAVSALVCVLGLLSGSGCALLHHGKAKTPHCPEPAVSEDVKNMPPLRAPAGLDAPDTRNAVKIPPLTEPLVARSPDAPCLSAPPSFGKQLEAYTGPSGPRAPGLFSWHVNGGGALTMGNSKDFLSTGWTLGGGVSYRPKRQSRFALQLDLGYADFNATRKLIDLGQQKVQYSIDGGTASVWLLSAAGKYTVPFTRNIDAYGLLGIGAYHEAVQLTESAIVGNIICDPWGFCYPVATDGVVTVVSKNLTKVGWNVGLGLEFAHSGRSSWFIESRYHSVQGSQSVQFLPLQIGFRY